MTTPGRIQNVLVTGATGFVGREVVRALAGRGMTPVCLVRAAEDLRRQHPELPAGRVVGVEGRLRDRAALREAAGQSEAVIHLVGIIMARRLEGKTFSGIHVTGTRNVVQAARDAGIRRFIHMSALGTRPGGTSMYHRTKYAAEQLVGRSGLDWTVFRPSLIHGPDGAFMQLMKRFICGLIPPVIPCFGNGLARVQPISVKDVADCMARSVGDDRTIGRVFPLGGPESYTWLEFYDACRRVMPGTRRWKPIVSLPVPVAKSIATMNHPLLSILERALPRVRLLRFDGGQVDMALEDSVCDHTTAEKAFGIRMRSFEDELALYADRIR